MGVADGRQGPGFRAPGGPARLWQGRGRPGPAPPSGGEGVNGGGVFWVSHFLHGIWTPPLESPPSLPAGASETGPAAASSSALPGPAPIVRESPGRWGGGPGEGMRAPPLAEGPRRSLGLALFTHSNLSFLRSSFLHSHSAGCLVTQQPCDLGPVHQPPRELQSVVSLSRGEVVVWRK